MVGINYGGSIILVDESATEAQMRVSNPLFFKNARQGEKRTVYRGFMIVESRVDFTGAPNTLCISVYVYDRDRDRLCGIGPVGPERVDNLNSAKVFIDAKLGN